MVLNDRQISKDWILLINWLMTTYFILAFLNFPGLVSVHTAQLYLAM